MTRPLRVFINGFGRIGRCVLRQILAQQQSAGRPIEVAGINDIAPPQTCAYLFQYDSVFGPYPEAVQFADGQLHIGARSFGLSGSPDLSALDLTDVDLVLECTGAAKTRALAEAGLRAGAGAVLISGPSEAADRTLVLGANEGDLGDARIVSNASCTTNAIAPLLRLLDESLGIVQAHVTTVHCYTGSQPTVDAPGPSLERSRAAAVSMVPTTTSAAGQITRVLPQFDGRLSVAALRVPCISVSAIDAVVQIARPIAGAVEDAIAQICAASPLIGLTRDACVSSDLRARPESLIIALPECMATGAAQVRVFGWYDNEWGFSARMLDMSQLMAARPA